jgi:hypothetical protein
VSPSTPTGGEILIGILFVVGGCLGAAVGVEMIRRTRNWLYGIVALGCALVVAGVVGQRTFPSDDAVTRYGQDAASRMTPGAWEAGVSIPVVNLHATPVALAGVLVALAGLALVLFFEPVPTEEGRRPVPLPRALEEDDAV